MEQFLRSIWVQDDTSSPRYPQSNGFIERIEDGKSSLSRTMVWHSRELSSSKALDNGYLPVCMSAEMEQFAKETSVWVQDNYKQSKVPPEQWLH